MAVTRCSGILLGVALSVVLAVVIFPKSASHQATDSLAAALEGLERLCGIAWNSPHLADELDEVAATQGSAGNLYLPLEGETGAAGGSGSSKIAREAREAECERVSLDHQTALLLSICWLRCGAEVWLLRLMVPLLPAGVDGRVQQAVESRRVPAPGKA